MLCHSILTPTGTVWMQEILPLVLHGGDLTPVQTILNWNRAPWIEVKKLAKVINAMVSPRALVTHLPYNLMPPSFYYSKAKVKRWKLCQILCAKLFNFNQMF